MAEKNVTPYFRVRQKSKEICDYMRGKKKSLNMSNEGIYLSLHKKGESITREIINELFEEDYLPIAYVYFRLVCDLLGVEEEKHDTKVGNTIKDNFTPEEKKTTEEMKHDTKVDDTPKDSITPEEKKTAEEVKPDTTFGKSIKNGLTSKESKPVKEENVSISGSLRPEIKANQETKKEDTSLISESLKNSLMPKLDN